MIKWAKSVYHSITDDLCDECEMKLDMGYNVTRDCDECKKKNKSK